MRSGLITDRNVTSLTPYPQWYGPPDNQNKQCCSTNLNNVHKQMEAEPVIDAADAEPEPPNPVHDILTICGITTAATCATFITLRDLTLWTLLPQCTVIPTLRRWPSRWLLGQTQLLGG